MKLMLRVYTMQSSSLKATIVQSVIPSTSDVGTHYAHRQGPLHMASVSAVKTGSVVWSGSMDVDKERRTRCANF